MRERNLRKINSKGRVANQVRNPKVFFETIRFENNHFHHLSYHEARMNTTRKAKLHRNDPIPLENYLPLPEGIQNGIYKCRVFYSDHIIGIEFEPYKKRTIQSLRLVDGGDLQYLYKSSDRSDIDELFDKRQHCDDILIIRNGRITDTSYANVAFWNGHTWVTPDSPLLEGTTRVRLLDEGKIVSAGILAGEIWSFKKIWIFNAMMQKVLPVNTTTIHTF